MQRGLSPTHAQKTYIDNPFINQINYPPKKELFPIPLPGNQRLYDFIYIKEYLLKKSRTLENILGKS